MSESCPGKPYSRCSHSNPRATLTRAPGPGGSQRPPGTNPADYGSKRESQIHSICDFGSSRERASPQNRRPPGRVSLLPGEPSPDRSSTPLRVPSLQRWECAWQGSNPRVGVRSLRALSHVKVFLVQPRPKRIGRRGDVYRTCHEPRREAVREDGLEGPSQDQNSVGHGTCRVPQVLG